VEGTGALQATPADWVSTSLYDPFNADQSQNYLEHRVLSSAVALNAQTEGTLLDVRNVASASAVSLGQANSSSAKALAPACKAPREP
ncbi:unnamed protein product, partial [Urochloa humidicola]